MYNPITFQENYREEEIQIPFVDDWFPQEEDKIIRYEAKDILIIPVSKLYGVEESVLNFFVLLKKRCYKSDVMRMHIALYLNYFEKYFDPDKELISSYAMIKYMIDNHKKYSKNDLFKDIKKYLLSPSIRFKVRTMNRYNYSLNLNSYVNKKDQALQYNDVHGMVLMEISILFNIVIPILTHYAYSRNTENVDEFILEMYDDILSLYSIDIYSKLYETSLSNTERNKKYNTGLWDMQDMRGKNVTTHTIDTSETLLLNIIPKYVYNQNIVKLNFGAMSNTLDYQVINIGYEFDYRSLSSSERDADHNSVYDKYESYLVKQNESLRLQNTVNARTTMERIENMFGPFDQDEINLYVTSLYENGDIQINEFQRDFLISNLFYKYFGDPESVKSLNKLDLIKLMISSKKILKSANMVMLPYIFSSKVEKIVKRKNLNKKESIKLKNSKYYQMIVNKYKNAKIEALFSEISATILSSKFRIIDSDPQLNGKLIDTIKIPELTIEEVDIFINMI